MKNQQDPPQPNRERELFLAAIQLQADERPPFLAKECGPDGELLRRIEALIEEHETQDNFLTSPAIALGGDTEDMQVAGEQPGECIGRYKLLQKIGEGGCGIVYMAEQLRPVQRRVALKIIKLGMDTKGVIARFEAERQALAMMDHPHIARVFDAGTTKTGRPYFVMELVRGTPITEYADDNHLTTLERLELFIQVCNAIQHAHQKGIIHRDIKPSNILVTLHQDVAVPKVIDFGIAKAIGQKLTEKTLFTLFHAFVGTPAYTSPEQTLMTSLDIDTRSDIYSLGALLYELLSGAPPFDPDQLISRGLDECRKTIRETEPARPSKRLSTIGVEELTTTANRRHTDAQRLIHQMRGDLDWIVMKCLDKDRTRRYETASALAADVRRYLESEPISARPPSTPYRIRKFMWKHRVVATATASVALALALGTGISIWLAIRATSAESRARRTAENEIAHREEAVREKAAARLNEYVAHINLAQQSLKEGNLGRAARLLQRHIPEDGEADLRGFEWRYLMEACKGDAHRDLLRQSEPVKALAVSPSGEHVALGDNERIHIVSLQDGTTTMTLTPAPAVPGSRFETPGRFPFPFSFIDSMAYVDGGRILASASHAAIRLWSTEDGKAIRTLEGASSPLAASPDGALLASQLSGERWWKAAGVIIWNAGTWESLRTLPDASGPMAFSSDGRRLATNSSEGILIWPVEGSGEPTLLDNSKNLFGWVAGRVSDRPMAFSPDGTHLVAVRNTVSEKGVFVLSIWDVASGREVGTMPSSPEHIEHTGVISSLAFSPEGRMLATASMDHSIRLWDFQQREPIKTLHGHLNEIWSLALAPNGGTLISGDKEGRVKVWETRRRDPPPPFPGIAVPLAFSQDSKTLAALDKDNAVVFINLATGEPVRLFSLKKSRGPFVRYAFSDDLTLMAQGHRDGTVTVWHIENGESDELVVSDQPIELLSVSPDGRYLIAGGRDQMPRWWDLRAGTHKIWEVDADYVRFSPDGQSMATFQGDAPATIWNVGNLQPRVTLESWQWGNQPFSPSAAFTSDGKRFAAARDDDSVGLWDSETGKFIGSFEGHKQPVYALAFSSDNRTLATGGSDSTMRLWNVATRTELLIDRQLGLQMRALVFSPDGHILVGGNGFGSRDGGLRPYHAPEVTTPTRHSLP